MPRVRVVLLVLLVLAAACGGPYASSAEDAADTEVGEASTSTTAEQAATTSALPATSTITPSADPMDDALQLMSSQWSTIEAWGDGWVEIRATASGSPVQPRDSEVGRLFPPEVYDAIEAAGATDMIAAYAAVSAAGVLQEVLDVLDEHPEAWDAILAGPGTLEMSAATTTDGESWDETPLPFFADGRFVASRSTGRRIALMTSPGEARHMSVAMADADLADWTIAEIATAVPVHSGSVQIAPLNDGWLVFVADFERTASTGWVVEPDGTVTEAVAPLETGCCRVEDTDAGVVAWDRYSDHSTELAFSTDGMQWDPRSLPEAGQSIVGVAAVHDGVILTTWTDDGRTLHWLGAADATGWSPIDLPAEIEWDVWIRDDHHRGVAQFVAVRGWGQRGFVPPPLRHSYQVDHDGMRFSITTDEQVTITVTDLATGDVVFDDIYSSGNAVPDFVTTADGEISFLDEANEVVVTIPHDLITNAMDEALAEAEAALPAIERAFRTATYLLHSPDGVTWSSSIVEPLGEDSHPHIAGSLNGDRVLIGGFDEYRVVDLDEG